MKYVPSNPPPRILPDDYWLPKAASSVRPVKPVQPRSTPPLVTRHNQAADTAAPKEFPEANAQEKRLSPSEIMERRTVCRRVFSRPALFELRASMDRRRNRQRETDRLENISQQV